MNGYTDGSYARVDGRHQGDGVFAAIQGLRFGPKADKHFGDLPGAQQGEGLYVMEGMLKYLASTVEHAKATLSPEAKAAYEAIKGKAPKN